MRVPAAIPASRRYAALDGWRGVAAVFVAISHLGADDSFRAFALVRNSPMLVDFFFVLSGFVIAHAYAGRLDSAEAFRHFALRRLARLWPLHLAMLLPFLALLAITSRTEAVTPPYTLHSAGSLLSNVFMVQWLGFHDTATWNHPSWSIGVEFYTYLVFGGLALLGRLRALPCTLLALAAALALSRMPAQMDSVLDVGAFLRCLYGFFLGVVAWHLRRGTASARWGTPHELAAMAVAALPLLATGQGGIRFLAPPAFALMVLVFSREAGLVSRLMMTRPLAALGRWSYSIYMVHFFVGVLVFNVVATIGSNTGLPVFRGGRMWLGDFTDLLTLAYLALVIGVSALTYRWIELPGQALPDRWDRRRKRTPPALASEE